MTRMLQRDLECFGTRHQHGHGGREGATQLALLYTAVQRFSGRLCAAPGLPSGRARRRPESCSAVPWMRKSHLGVCYDDSASAAERRSASKAMQLEGSPHRLLTAEGLPACPVSLAGPAASPCPSPGAPERLFGSAARHRCPCLSNARANDVHGTKRSGWLKIRGLSANPTWASDGAAANDIAICTYWIPTLIDQVFF